MDEFSNKLLSIFTNELKGINLTRILNEEEFFQKQIQDSLIPALEIPVFRDAILNCECIADIGFGGGFPLLPLANYYKDKVFLGFEARNKKVDAVTLIADKMNLNNVKVFHERVEDIYFDKKCVITFKAVGKINKFLMSLNVTLGCEIFFYKGMNVFEEEKKLDFPGYTCICKEKVEIPGPEKITRYLIGYRSNVPRGTKKKKKNISDFY